MPEGDTIFRAARTLNQALSGKEVTRFETVLAQLARVDDDAPIKGRTIERVEAQGKHLLMYFSGDLVLRTHMRMNGSWHIYRPGERWQRARARMRMVVATKDFEAVGFDIPVAELYTARELEREDAVRLLGPDLLKPDFDYDEAKRRIRARGALPIGETLLNQRVVAGIGNVFKSELCFIAGVHPFTPTHRVNDAEVDELLRQAVKLLRANVADGKGDGIVTYFGMRRTTGRSNPEERVWVYSRSGQPCRKCGTKIEFDRQGLEARVTYWCPKCQPLRSAAG